MNNRGGNMIFIIIYGIGILAALIHLARSKDRSSHNILTIALTYFFLCLGLVGIWGFIGHTFYPDQIAQYVGWPTGNPFQLEIAWVNLGLAIVGLLGIFIRGNFWLATLIMTTVFFWGAAYEHLVQMLKFQDYSPGNSGAVLYLDLIVPLVGIVLFIAHKFTKPEVKAMFSLMKDVQDMLKKSGLNINL
jgi:hypothetical protein